VARVHEPDALVHAPGVDGRDVEAGEREGGELDAPGVDAGAARVAEGGTP